MPWGSLGGADMSRIQGTGYGIGSVPSYKTNINKVSDSDKENGNSSSVVSKDDNTAETKAAVRSTDVYEKSSRPSAEERQKIIDTLTGGGSGAPGISYTKEYGSVVGDVKLSDDAKKVYDSLKSKYGDMAFVLVSAEHKDTVADNAGRYGVAGKATVLIDEEKLEKMASDPEYRKEIEAKIELGRTSLQQMATQMSAQTGGDGDVLASYGMKFNDDGSTSYFATFDKAMQANREQAKKLDEKRQAEKAEQKKAEEKYEAKKAEQKREAERIEKAEETKKLEKEGAEKARETENSDETAIDWDSGNYVTLSASSIDELMEKISAFMGNGSSTAVAGSLFDASV